MRDELITSTEDDLAHFLLFQDREVVIFRPWEIELLLYLCPMWFSGLLFASVAVGQGRVPEGWDSFGKYSLIVTLVWALFVFVVNVRFPRRVRLQNGHLTVQWWFGKKKGAAVWDFDIIFPSDGSESFLFIGTDFSFRLNSSWKNLWVLIDAIQTADKKIDCAIQIAPMVSS